MGDVDFKEEDNMGAWLIAPNTLRLEPVKLPPTGSDEVKVQMKAVGICGSDVHYYRHLRCADFIVKEPMVIGHESAGIVVEVGSRVTHLQVGDRVALEPGIACSHCIDCKSGAYNLCANIKFFATPPVHGSLANYVVHPAELCFKLPEGVSLEEGAMCEPLSVGVHACRRAGIGPDVQLLILGAGPIGLVTLLAARAFGAARILVTDVDMDRLSLAKHLGADDICLVSTHSGKSSVEEEVVKLRELMGEGGIHVSMDCVGLQSTMCTALKATRAGGKVCLIGMGHPEMTLPLTGAAAAREVDVVGVFRYRNTYPLCLHLIASNRIDVKPLITHRFSFTQEQVVDAFETSARGGNAIKVMFNL